MTNGVVGLHLAGQTAAETLAEIVDAEARGVPAVWLTTGGARPDALTLLAAAAVSTERVLLGTSIIPTFPRHPLVTVSQTLVIDSLAPGRFRLGVGPSHKPTMEGMFDIPFERPLRHLRAYLDVLNKALREGAVDREEAPYRVHARLPAPVNVPVYASALQVKSFELCGEAADGAITWMCPLAYVRDVALPAFRRGAEKAGRPLPKLIVHVPVCVSENVAAVREAARRQLGFYMRVPSYARMSATAGYPDAAEHGMSDAQIDDLVLHGSEAAVADHLQEWLNIGADEIIVAPVAPEEQRETAMARTVALVADFAKR